MRTLEGSGLTLGSYAALMVWVETFSRLAWVVLGALVFVLRSGDRMALLVANFLVVFGTATFAIAALFNSLRRRVQAFVDRRFYRQKYDAVKTLEAFGARLRGETNLDALTGDLVGVVSETMRPEHASLWPKSAGDSGESQPPDAG